MTSWPWMKGIDVAIADPIPPIDEHDTRPSVKELIAEYKVKIDELKDLLLADAVAVDLLEYPTKHDDLWLLRFLLSHKMKPKLALKAAIPVLEYRRENKLDEHDIRRDQIQKNKTTNPYCQRYFEFVTDEFLTFTVPDPKRGVIFYMNSAALDQHQVVKNLPESHWGPYFSYMSEWTHQWVDYVTRTTGRLTKSIAVVGVKGMTPAKISMENQRRNGKVMRLNDGLYPQQLHGSYIMNPPSWAQVPWKIVRSILPKRITEKINFLHPSDRPKELNKLLSLISIDHLPERYGGTHESWPPECVIPEVPNLPKNE